MISSKGVKRLFINLARSSKTIEERKLAREQLKKQIGKVKKISKEIQPQKRKLIEDEIAKLEKHFEELLEKEKSIITMQKKDDVMITDLHHRTKGLEQNLDKVSSLLANLSSAVEDIREKEEVIEKETSSTEKKLEILRKNLALLEERHGLLKQTGKHKPEDLERIEGKIGSLKAKLSFLSEA